MSDDVRNEIEALKRRVAVLEAKERVARAMYNWARWLDRVEATKALEDAEYIAHELMTEDGIFHLEQAGWGMWGPDKAHITTEILRFASSFDWAHHYYHHGEIDVNLDLGTAHFYTGAECVPLKMAGKGKWLFLVQNTDWVEVGGVWKVKQYHLSQPRLVSGVMEEE